MGKNNKMQAGPLNGMNREEPFGETMEENDENLLAAYRNGDTEALAVLVEKYKRPLFGFILRFSNGQEDADEVFQEVWVRAIKNMNRYRQKNLLSWLFRIAHNLMIDRIRQRRPMVSFDTPATDQGVAVGDVLAHPGQGPDIRTGGRDLGRRIEAAADKLPPEQKEVFWMRMQSGLSFKQIARIQNCSINTALARMHYAVARLRGELAGEYREWKGAQ